MSRIYTVVMDVDVTAAETDVDWVELNPASNKPIRLVGLVLSQHSELGDAQEEEIDFDIIRVPATATSGSGGTAPTPQKVDTNDAAAGFSAEVHNTTVATSTGSLEYLDTFDWNVRSTPYERWWPDPETRFNAINGQLLVLRQQSTVADTISCKLTAYVEEV
jgi:hypothetical protein